jgi:glycosyltransferase involved in cell wall biosynthesis
MDTSKPLKILHIIDHFYPQLGYQETFLPKVETEQGYTVYVLTSNLYDKTLYEANKGILGQKKTKVGQSIERGIKTIRLSAFHLPIVNKLYLLGLEEAIVKLRPDVIICHGIVFLTSIRVARLKRHLNEVKLIFDDHMTYNATRGGWTHIMYKIFKIIFTPMLMKNVDRFVAAVSPETKRFMEDIYGIPTSRIEVISLGVDRSIFRYNYDARMTIRRKYGIKDNDIIFLYVGKIIPEKGVNLLVNAALKLCKKYYNVKIMMIGGSFDSYIKKMMEKVKKSGFVDRFIFIDAIPNSQLYQFYSAGDVGVWPLQCSISMLEAMSCSLPIIISDKSGTPERVNEGTGLLYHEGDVNDLRIKMEEMYDERLRKDMSRNAEKYMEMFDWNIISKQFLNFVIKK